MILADRLGRSESWSAPHAVAWVRARPSLAISVVLAAWTLAPLLRRLVDWKVGFNSISIISVLPLLLLVPAVLALLAGKRLVTLDPALRLCAWLWAGGFTYALTVAVVSGNTFGGLYTYAEFVLPAAFGLWVATTRLSFGMRYERIASAVLALSTPLSIYGLLQFANPFPWDVAWMRHANVTSIGVPLPFQLRPFSTLNSPGLFADFLVFAIVLNLPRLRAASPWRFAAIVLAIATLTVTMVRSDWAAIAVAILAYLLVSPHRVRNVSAFAAIALVCGVLFVNASALLGSSDAGAGLSNRFSTLGNLSNDVSFYERGRYFGEILTQAIDQPVGQGLGVLGTAAKLGNTGTTHDFDNGYVARFTEMGYFGMTCYVATLLLGLGVTLRRLRTARREGRSQRAQIVAAALAVQVALLALDLSSDHHNAFDGVMFWLALALTSVPAPNASTEPR